MNDWQKAVDDLHSACRDTFGVPISYIPSLKNRPLLGGVAHDLTGIFDEARETVSLMGGGSGGMETVVPRPVVELRQADISITPMEGDTVVVGEISYRILEVQPDGLGAVVLVLNRV
ncbi:MAG: hypothetical protein HQL82_13660 [Magnetococcales bacterium]|nr:hypothetical protein [Magnetococcales bacterium]